MGICGLHAKFVPPLFSNLDGFLNGNRVPCRYNLKSNRSKRQFIVNLESLPQQE